MTTPKIKFDIEANATGDASVRTLTTELERLDSAIDPNLAKQAQELADRLGEIGRQQAAIETFTKTKTAADSAATALADAQTAAQGLSRSAAASAQAIETQATALVKARETAVALAQAQRQAQIAQRDAADAAEAARLEQAKLNQELAESRLATEQRSREIKAAQASLQAAVQAERDFAREVKASGKAARDSNTDIEANARKTAELASATQAARDAVTTQQVALASARSEQTRLAAAVAAAGTAMQQQAAASREAASNADAAASATRDAANAASKQESALSSARAEQTKTTGQLEKLKDAVRAAKTELTSQTSALDQARAGLTALGVPTEGLASKQAELRTAMRSTRDELAQLNTSAGGINTYAKLSAATEDARLALVKAEAELAQFQNTLVNGQPATKAQAANLDRLTASARQSQIAFQSASIAQAEATASARAAGVNVDAVTAAQQRQRAAALASAEASREAATATLNHGRAASTAAQQHNAAATTVREGLDGIGSQLRTLQGLAGTVLGGQLLAGTAGDVLKTADAYANLGARVKLVTGEGAAFNTAFSGVLEVAKATSSQLESTGTLFARLAAAGKDIGVSNQQALDLTRTINQAVQVSGASAEASDQAVTQLIQGLQSGVVRGEEFNSIMEQAPRLSRALADGLGIPIGKLREFAEAGKLTTQTVIQALQTQREVVEREFGSLPATVGRAITNLQTEWTKFVGQTSQSTGATTLVANGINLLASNLQNVADVAGRAGAVLTAALAVQGVQALRAFVAEGRAATVTATALSTSLGSIPKVISITVAAVGFEIGFQLGEMLRENSALARQLGVAVAGFFQATVSDLQLLAESAGAIFSNDTISAALDRYKTRAQQLDESFTTLWEDAKNAPKPIAAAADQAATSMQGLGTTATAAGTAAASAGAAGAAGIGAISTQANAALSAIQALATGAGVSLPGVGASASTAAQALLSVVLKGGDAARVFQRDLPEAISKLGGADLAAFGSAVNTTLTQVVRDSERVAAAMTAAGQSGAAELSKADAAAKLLQQTMAAVGTQAAKSLGVDVAPLTTGLTSGFKTASDNLATLVQSLPALKAAGVDTGTAVSQAIAGMLNGAQTTAEFDAIKARLQALGQAGILSGQQVQDGLRLATTKAEELRLKIDEATPGIQSLAEAAKAAGVDLGALTTGVSKGFSDSITNIQALAAQIDAAGLKAQTAGPVLAQALNQQAAAARTEQEARAVVAQIEAIIAKSPQLAASLGGALEAARAKAAELTPEMQRTIAAAERLGITLGTSAQQGVASAIQAYETLKASGKASAEQLTAAFVRTAQEATAAAGGVVPEWVKVEAEFRNVQISSDDCATSFSTVGARAAAAGSQVSSAFAGAAQSIRAAGEEVDAFNTKQRNAALTAESAASDAARKSINSTSVDAGGYFKLKDKLAAGTLGESDRALAEAVLAAEKNNSLLNASANPSAISFEGRRDAEARMANAVRALEQINAAKSAADQAAKRAADQAAADKAAREAQAAQAKTTDSTRTTTTTSQTIEPVNTSRTVTVNLTLGGASASVPTTESGAAALLALLEQAKAAIGS